MIHAIIQARMNSTRLPGKTLKLIEGKPLLHHVVERIKKSSFLKKIIVVTSTNPVDDVLESFCKENNISLFRGNENDVLDRFYQAAKMNSSSVIVRITADDPFKDPEIIDQAIKTFFEGNYDYVSNTIKPTYPEGIDIEVFSFKALETAWNNATLLSEREHVTPYIWKNKEIFNTFNFEYHQDLSYLRWTIDNPEDLAFAREIYKKLYQPGKIFLMNEILGLLDKEPDLVKINKGTLRNEGYMKSTLTDKNMVVRIGPKEREYVSKVMDYQFKTSKGSIMMKKLESSFSQYFKSDHTISHINGTATLHSCLAAAGISIGDEVILPPLTMASTAFAVLHQFAIPIFADVDPETFTISPEAIEKVISDKTKAIITVSIFGLSPDMDKIMEIAKKHNLVVIEDNAQCFLGKYKGRIVGDLGHMASYSFQSSKHITSGEGGMVITNDQKLALKVRRFSSLGYKAVGVGSGKITKKDIQNPNYFRHSSVGFNYRIPELCAAVALAQVERMEKLVKRRIEVANLFSEIVNDCSWLIPQRVPKNYEHSFWSFVIKLEHPSIIWEEFRDKFVEFGGDGIYACWKLTYQEPAFQQKKFNGVEKIIGSSFYDKEMQNYNSSLCPNAEKLQPKLLQFKTNYWNWKDALKNAHVLRKTINYFNE